MQDVFPLQIYFVYTRIFKKIVLKEIIRINVCKKMHLVVVG